MNTKQINAIENLVCKKMQAVNVGDFSFSNIELTQARRDLRRAFISRPKKPRKIAEKPSTSEDDGL